MDLAIKSCSGGNAVEVSEVILLRLFVVAKQWSASVFAHYQFNSLQNWWAPICSNDVVLLLALVL